MTNTHTFPILENYVLRACYSDTDSAGVIHHARILEFLERSRTEWLSRMNSGPNDLSQRNLLLIIREININFNQPGRLEDSLIFSHQVVRVGNSQFMLEQKIFRLDKSKHNTINPANSDLLASATFNIVCVNSETMKSCPIPENLRSQF
jgi:acyl-CoA thioester hydrolase